MSPSLSALIALQSVDSAIETSRRRLADLPKAEQDIEAGLTVAKADLDAARTRLQETLAARRALEKDVAAVDTRLARFDDHKAAVKTNQEYTALLHEIATAKAEKDAIEERILLLMEDGDARAAEVKTSETHLADANRAAETARAAFSAERKSLQAEIDRLSAERSDQTRHVDSRSLAVYEQLLKMRRGVAVAQMIGEVCAACHVRQRPPIAQIVRRNDEIVQCESCQRILYFQPPAHGAQAPAAAP
jgi:predicted  nucleic acid-binding Zn-ribbon protein